MLTALVLSLVLQVPPVSKPTKPEGQPPVPAKPPSDAATSKPPVMVSPGGKKVAHYITGPGETEVEVGDVLLVTAMILPITEDKHHPVVTPKTSVKTVLQPLANGISVEKEQAAHIFVYLVVSSGETDITFTLGNSIVKVEAPERVFKVVAKEEKHVHEK